jgi:anti-anti-sigma factor
MVVHRSGRGDPWRHLARPPDTPATAASDPAPSGLQSFDLRVVPSTERLRLVAIGDFDVQARGFFLAKLEAQRPLLLPLTIDLRNVRLMDSTGLRCLLYADQGSAEDAMGRVRLVGVGPAIGRLLQLSGLAGRFDVVDEQAG